MSRTYRKRKLSYNEYYRVWFEDSIYPLPKWMVEYLRVEKYRYKTTSAKHYSFGLPRWYRNWTNKIRRRKDKHEIYKAINFNDYPEQCSDWTCKDSNKWGYW